MRTHSLKHRLIGVVLSLMTIAAVVGVLGYGDVVAKERFVDNGDGTITDNETDLQWEKKSDICPGVHCFSNTFTWFNARDSFIPAVNDSSADGVTVTGLGGHTDWRLPTIAELRTILLPTTPPCPPGLCIPPFGSFYWSSTSHASFPSQAFGVDFASGFVFSSVKSNANPVRAVRGGR